MAVKFSNNAKTSLASALNSTATSVSVSDASKFPTLGAGDYTYATIAELSNSVNLEIVKVTAISGNTLTVVRAQQGTSALSFSSGDPCEVRVTAGTIEEAITDVSDTLSTVATTGAYGDLSGTPTLATVATSGAYSDLTGTPSNISTFTNDSGYLTSYTETDPVFTASPSSGITSNNITNWNTAYGWGDHTSAGYLTSFTETDPTVPSHVKSITTTEKSNWNTAYGWGNHASAGYLTSFTETDPTVPSHVKSITTTEKSNWNTAYSWGNHASAGYALTSALSGYVSRNFEDSSRNLVIPTNTAVLAAGLALESSAGNFLMQLYGTGGNFGFLDAQWGNWDLKKTSGGQLEIDVGGTLQTVWHTGNDGSGSGLDADTVDGIQGGSFLRSDASDSFTGQLTMSTQKALIASDYGHGVYGVYSASKYQHVWSMGTAYNVPADGASTGNVGNLYGLAWTYNPNYGGTGNNAQAKDGLNHQLLLCMNGITYTALGNGIWTSGSISRNGNTVWDAGNDGSGSGLDADTVDGIQGASFLRSDADDAFTGNLTTGQNNYITFGPNSTWNSYLRVGGNGRTVNGDAYASMVTTNGNLHLDAGNSMAMYLNYYAGTAGVGFGSGGSSVVAWMGPDGDLWKGTADNSGSKYWHAGNDGSGSGLDADTLDGSGWLDYTRDIHANQVIADDWLRTTGQTGWYSNTYGGGWYMTDTTWIRSYNSKSIYQNAGTLRTDGTLQVGGSGATLNAPNGGTVTISGNTAWHAGNDGSGSGLDADTVDGIQGSSIMRVDDTQTIPDGVRHIYECYGNIATSSGYQSSLEIFNSGAGTDAFLTFHVGGDFAAYFGLDGGTNDLAYGGWSAGAASYKVWHAANDGSGSGLDADTLDGYQGSNYIGLNGNSYFQLTTWLQSTGTHGLYFPSSGAGTHFYPSDLGNYGSFRVDGRKAGWSGISLEARVVFMHNGGNESGIYNDVNNHWLFYAINGDKTAMYHNGSEKIYTYASGGRVTGDFLATGDIYAYYSDERLKDKTGKIENALDKVDAIETFYYTHNDKANELGYDGKDQQVGVSAQSVAEVMPEVVHLAPIDDDGQGNSISGENYQTVNYARLVPLLIESIKELRAEVKDLKEQLK